MKPFNVRVYALLVHDAKVLVMHEPFLGKLIYKFPGGGLEFGEGTRDCLVRELKEELNLEIEVEEHLYTQDFFMQNVFDPEEQIILIYYKASISDKNLTQLKVLERNINQLLWMRIDELYVEDFTLVADKKVIEIFREKYLKK
ncbi:NUDIX domain-containing protein [Weeksella virosa]|uniref:NUDIX domain-containing protein n=1 Tax=Weeksella virosa TaxID=1014 RepID=UPI002552AE0C|nr:NUDIX domain-containing protein [Weeksella virosa]MDK7674838.1 NUDIX domain-containing protein [Weeksella virosa]